MAENLTAPQSRLFFILKVALPAMAALAIFMFVAGYTLFWATSQIDRSATKRQISLAELVLNQTRASLAHDQESATVWSAAVQALTETKDMAWVDSNLGSWMHSYFGHDAIYIIDSRNQPVFAFAEGEVRDARRYNSAKSAIEPMAKDLRVRLAAGDQTGVSERVQTIGATDFRIIDGHPAIVSLKPVVSDNDEFLQEPGTEYLHIAIRYLDGTLATQLAGQYQLTGLRFQTAASDATDHANLALIDAKGTIQGYFTWEADRPGSAFLTSILPMLWLAGTIVTGLVIGIVAVLYRRSVANARNQARIAHLALHDALTGLPNRRNLDQTLDAMLAEPMSADDRLAVVYLDLDRFKQVNDTLGHAAGDVVIREAGNRILANLKGQGRLYRIGGDEFMIAVREKAVSSIETLASAIIEDICKPITIGTDTVFIGVSIGIAFAPDHGTDRLGLARKADVALYHAKENGRSQFSIFGAQMDHAIAERVELERDMRDALASHSGFMLHYQPKYNAADMALVGVEALVRWIHPKRGTLSPDIFIPLAEDTGMIIELGRQILQQACLAAVKWPSAMVAVNVSPLQLRDPSFALNVVTALEQSGLQPHRLELEITETTWIADNAVANMNIATIRRLGVSVALDDFGTGFSSLGRLHETRIDRLKIDQRFVKGLGQSRGDEAIVRAIIEMARANNMTTTGEGVETHEQGEFLRQAGCDELQGFLMSRPVPEADILALYSQREGNPARGNVSRLQDARKPN